MAATDMRETVLSINNPINVTYVSPGNRGCINKKKSNKEERRIITANFGRASLKEQYIYVYIRYYVILIVKTRARTIPRLLLFFLPHCTSTRPLHLLPPTHCQIAR
jgi:hypothetical protein